jgi:hypothetical protein
VKARLIVALAMALTAAPGGPASGGEASDPDPPPPFFDATRQRVEYAGPGRDDPEPAGIDEVRIGYFGPSDPSHPLGGDMWLASRLAVEEANRDGGYRGIPFRLVPSWSDTPWGTGVADLARRVYSEGVWAIIGSIDGASTHLAEQVVAKARLTLINPAGTDKTVNLANVAWMFSCLPADDALARVLGLAIMDEIGRRPFVVLSTTDHDSHHAALELTTYLGREGRSPLYLMEFETGATDLSSMLERVATHGASRLSRGRRIRCRRRRLSTALRCGGFLQFLRGRVLLTLRTAAGLHGGPDLRHDTSHDRSDPRGGPQPRAYPRRDRSPVSLDGRQRHDRVELAGAERARGPSGNDRRRPDPFPLTC